MIIVTSSFSRSSINEMFPSSRKQNSAFLNSSQSGLKSDFDKLRFRDGLPRDKAELSNFSGVLGT